MPAKLDAEFSQPFEIQGMSAVERHNPGLHA